ncbi:MAG: extracellular solute-binding protein [Atopobiaceae bacterium]|jgi:multiple sugar transport system substrate-binding protein
MAKNLTRRGFLGGAAVAGTSLAAMGMVGCSNQSSDSSEGADNSSSDKVNLQFWCHENQVWTASYEAMAKAFEESHPEYHVEVTSYPYDVYNDKIQTALSSTSGGPDVIAVWGGMAPSFIETDALSPVPDDLASELSTDYLEPTVGIYKKEGICYGVPEEFNLEYGGILVNKKLFDEAGLEYPTTWDEMRAISKQVAVRDGDINTMSGIELVDTDALICNYLAMILQQGGTYYDEDGTVNFNTPEGIKAMQEMVSTVKDGDNDLRHLSDGDYDYVDVFEDKAYGGAKGPWAIAEGTDSYKLTYGEDFEYIPMPLYGDKQAFAAETGWGLIVPANGKNVDAAWEYVKFFSAPENLIEHNIACYQLPPRASLLDSDEYKSKMPQMSFILDMLPSGTWFGPYNTSDFRTIFNNGFIELCESENPDYEGVLTKVSEQITKECKISYSMD